LGASCPPEDSEDPPRFRLRLPQHRAVWVIHPVWVKLATNCHKLLGWTGLNFVNSSPQSICLQRKALKSANLLRSQSSRLGFGRPRTIGERFRGEPAFLAADVFYLTEPFDPCFGTIATSLFRFWSIFSGNPPAVPISAPSES
jgi:hypothetical protein